MSTSMTVRGSNSQLEDEAFPTNAAHIVSLLDVLGNDVSAATFPGGQATPT